MIFAIWLRMNLKESPVFEKVSEGEKIASVNACVRKYIGRDVYQQIFLAGHRFTFWGRRGILGLFKPSLPDIWFRRYYLTNLSQPMR
ncbi:putative transport protein [Salmonella enterica subsp. enterica]|uniref:Putative transport protein n=1 Tax=Salmonella enterica I TaxID=59201 RepID=A0A379WU01_SALET|nr:putative transport protein [Salmonella enterica subsp. enterica]